MTAPRIDVVQGTAASALLLRPEFRASWDSLVSACPWATPFQSSPYAAAWYEAYADRYDPVLVRQGAADAITGLLILARDKRSGAIVHAGAHQAEYQVWLAPPGQGATFALGAFDAIGATFRGATLRFRYLPDSALGQELISDTRWAQRIRLQPKPRPLIRISYESIMRSFGRVTKRIPKLERQGTLRFRRVTQPEEIREVMKDLVLHYDLRQGAVYGTLPFHEDPGKLPFHEALAVGNPRLVHLTSLHSGSQFVAAQFGFAARGVVHQSILGFSPMFANYSPGILHLYLLARAMDAESARVLDLTPGGDPYKDQIASHHDEVAEMLVTPSASRRSWVVRSEQSLEAAKRVLAPIGVTPQRVRAVLPLLRRATPARLLLHAARFVREDRELRVYRIRLPIPDAPAQPAPDIHRNCLDDLLHAEVTDAWHSRKDVLAAALARLERGESVFTIRDGERLAHFGWLIETQKESEMDNVDASITLPDGTAVLYDFYTHPAFRGRGYYGANIRHMLRSLATNPKVRFAHISVMADNRASRVVIERSGFEYVGSYHWRQRLGRVTKWVNDPTGRLRNGEMTPSASG